MNKSKSTKRLKWCGRMRSPFTGQKPGSKGVAFRATLLCFVASSVSMGVNPPEAAANVVGGPTENFHPITNGQGFISVHSAKTLPRFTLNLGGFLNYAMNTLPVYERVDGEQSRTKVSDSVFVGHLHIGYGILDIWDIGVAVPGILGESVKGSNDVRGNFAEKGITDYIINTKVRMVGDHRWGLAGVASVNFSQLREDPYSGKNAGPTYTLELAADWVAQRRLLLAGNVGFRIRTPGDPLEEVPEVEPIGNSVIFSTAASFALTPNDFVIGELFGSAQTTDSVEDSDRQSAALEFLGGFKHVFRKIDLSLIGGIGTEVFHGHATADWRAVLGVNWQVGLKRGRQASAVTPASAPNPEVVTIDAVLFAFNSDRLVLKGQNTTVLRLKDKLLNSGFKKLIIVGHTDSMGTAAYNRSLSYRRAVTLKNWLVSNYNLNSQKIRAIGMGESQPVSTNASEAGRRKNRRVEFKIYR